MKNIPILSYIKRYWFMLAILAVLIYAYKSGSIALAMRGALLVPIFILISAASVLLLRNVLNRKTTDPYVDDKLWLKRDWADLTPFQRVLLTKVEAAAYFLGASIIAATLLTI